MGTTVCEHASLVLQSGIAHFPWKVLEMLESRPFCGNAPRMEGKRVGRYLFKWAEYANFPWKVWQPPFQFSRCDLAAYLWCPPDLGRPSDEMSNAVCQQFHLACHSAGCHLKHMTIANLFVHLLTHASIHHRPLIAASVLVWPMHISLCRCIRQPDRWHTACLTAYPR